MSKIRLWKLGVLDGANSIIPTKSAIDRLREILSEIPEEGTFDLVWGPELNVVELNEDSLENTIDSYVVESMEEEDGLLTVKARKV